MTFSSDRPRVLITGLNGFTGTHLAAKLRTRQYDVYGLVNPTSGEKIDLTNEAGLTTLVREVQPDYVIHLAAVSFVAHENSQDFYQTNLFGTLNLLQALQTNNITPKKIIIASSANIYGNPQQDYIDENTYPLPVNHYSNSKLAMENMVRLWYNEFPIVMTRPFNYTGPGQSTHFLAAKIVDHFQNKKQSIQLGNLDIVRDISDIDFVVEAYIRLLEHDTHSEIFNICSNQGYSIADILGYLHKIAGYNINVEVAANLVRTNEIKRLIGSNQKLFSTVGNIPTPTLYETLSRMYANVKETV